jgi:hypothetical protein
MGVLIALRKEWTDMITSAVEGSLWVLKAFVESLDCSMSSTTMSQAFIAQASRENVVIHQENLLD